MIAHNVADLFHRFADLLADPATADKMRVLDPGDKGLGQIVGCVVKYGRCAGVDLLAPRLGKKMGEKLLREPCLGNEATICITNRTGRG